MTDSDGVCASSPSGLLWYETSSSHKMGQHVVLRERPNNELDQTVARMAKLERAPAGQFQRSTDVRQERA